MFSLIWRFKYLLSIISIILFVFCFKQLLNANIYFDSERIINELGAANVDINVLDDNNLVFFGLSFEDSLSYQDMLDVTNLHKSLKRSEYVKRVFSLVNDRQIINSGLFPISKKVLNVSDKESYIKSIKKIDTNGNNFISSDGKKLLFLVENVSGLNKEDSRTFINSLYETDLNENMTDVFVSGRSASELYFEKKVIQEFIILTSVSGFLCFLFLLLITKNLKLVVLTVFSVIASIVVSLGLSQVLFGGIELVMIITPAILFIVCLSDIMHLTNKQSKVISCMDTFFINRMDKVGKAVALTSITTAMSFLTFLVNDIVPILRFGLITSLGVVFTLFIAILVYAISVHKNFNESNPVKLIQKFTDSLINFLKSGQKSKVFHIFMCVLIFIGLFGVTNVQIDNYLTDEINKKSMMYKQTAFFDSYFGGIKPLTIFLDKENVIDLNILSQVEKSIKGLGFVIDFSNTNASSVMLSQLGFVDQDFVNKYFYVCRSGDEGSLATLEKLKLLKNEFTEKGLEFNYSGAGYLFDILANDLTRQLIFGLIIAIFSIGLVFFILNRFDFNYFIIAIVPNLTPIVVCVGLLYLNGFYFSLSNAFIFTVVFGLIIDDSIHLISAYANSRKRKISKSESLNIVVSKTGDAILKTTLIVIICLFPLCFSEFKSVSQLSVITILSAFIAIFFDLVYLPLIIKRLTK